MRIASVSDFHIDNHQAFAQPTDRPGLNSRALLCLETLERALQLGLENDCEVFLSNGDLMNSSKPTPVLLHAVGELFVKYLHKGYREILLTNGNHEQSSQDERHTALAPLDNITGVSVAAGGPVMHDYHEAQVVVLPFRKDSPGAFCEASLASLLSGVPGGVPRLLSVHFGLITNKTSKALMQFAAKGAMCAKELSQVASKFDISAVHLGDWHHKDQYKPRKGACCYQPGTACPASFSDPIGVCGNLMVWDSESPRKTEFIPLIGPRFIDITKSWEGQEPSPREFYRLTGTVEDIRKLEASAPSGAQYKTRILTDESVKENIEKISQSDNIELTVRKYVQALELQEELAQKVLTALQRYING